MQSLYDRFNASALRISKSLLPENGFQKFHLLTLDYRTPILVSILYVIVVSYFSNLNRRSHKSAAARDGKRTSSRVNGNKEKDEGSKARFTPFKCLVIAHNVFLCLYSAITFLSAVPIILRPYFTGPILQAFCDIDKSTYLSGVNFWIWNFYTFHHSGSIIGMWILTTTHAPAAWIFVLFNSFIHTVMYFYYTLTCFGFRPTWKKILTSMQIVQFLVGNPLGILYALLPGCFPLEIIPPENVLAKVLGSQARSLYVCLFVNTFFISSLVVLFTDFSKKTYGALKTNTKATAAAAAATVKVTQRESKKVKSSKGVAGKPDEFSSKKSPKLSSKAVKEVEDVKTTKRAMKKPATSARSKSPTRTSASTRRSTSPVRSTTRPKRA